MSSQVLDAFPAADSLFEPSFPPDMCSDVRNTVKFLIPSPMKLSSYRDEGQRGRGEKGEVQLSKPELHMT